MRVSRLLEEADPVLLFDEGGTCTYANATARAILGTETSTPVGRAVGAELAAAGEPSLRDALAAASTTGAAQALDLHHPASGRWLEGRVVPVDGAIAVYLRDITEHRRRETAVVQARHALLSSTAGGLTGSFVIDLVRARIQVSPTAMEIYGLDPADGEVRSWMDVRSTVHPDDLEATSEVIREVTAHPGQTADLIYRIRRASTGEVRLVHVVGVVVRDEAGNPRTLNGSISDVTDLQASHDALVASEDRLRRTLDNVDAIVSFQEHAGAPVVVSSAVERILGFRPDEMTSFETWDRLIHPDDVAGCRAAWDRREEPWYLRYRVRRADGAWVWIADRGRWIARGDGRGSGMFSVAVDATRAVAGEEALRASEARYRALTNSAHDAILTIDTDGRIVGSNPAAEHLFGYRADDLAGLTIARLIPSGQVAAHEAATGRPAPGLPAEPAERAVEMLGVRSDGTEFAIEVSVAAWSVGDGQFVTAIIRDAEDRRRAVDAARVADERRRRFFDVGVIGTAIADPGGTVLEINDYLLRLLGRTRAEADAGTLHSRDVTAPESLADDVEAVAIALERGTCPPYEKTYLRPDGTRVPALITRALLPGPEPQLASFVLDMTERHEAQAGIARLAAAVEQMSESVMVADLDARLLYVNPAFERISGYSRAEALGRNPRMLRSGHQDAAFYDRMWAVLGAGRTWAGEFVNLRKDGSLYDEEASITPIRDASGAVTSYVAVKRDVTLEKRALAALRSSEDRLRRTLEGVDAIIAFQDGPDRPLVLSPQVERILGYKPTSLASYANWHAITHPDDLPACIAAWDGPPGAWDIEYRVRHADSRWIWIADRGRKEHAPDGAATSAISALVDITGRRTLEAQLRQSQRLEAVGQLAGGVAHDMNNILAAITGYGAFVAEALGSEGPAAADMRQVLLAAERATSLTRQLLSFSRRLPLVPRVVDVASVVDGLVPMLTRLLGEHITVEVEHVAGAGKVLADPGQLEQVVVNLAVNARDAMPRGGRLGIRTLGAFDDEAAVGDVEVRGAAAGPAAARCVRLEVSDTGTGMDDATIAHIFEPFFTTKEPGKGTGLGLATVYYIVTGSGGRLAVRSQPGAGTTFTIDLPCAGEQVEAPPMDLAGTGIRFGTETVLVAEDDAAVRAVTGRMLEGLGYRVHLTDGALAALAASEAGTGYDVLVTDVRMPGMQGPELARRLRSARPDLPVVFLTAFAPDLDGEIGPLEGAHLVPKPFTSTELGAAVRAALTDQGR